MLELDNNVLHHRNMAENNAERRMIELGATRKHQLKTYYANNPVLFEIEKEYGKYFYVPLDIPKFKFNDLGKFLEWWNLNNTVIGKDDVGPADDYYGAVSFKSIDIVSGFAETNKTADFIELFPEILEQMRDYLPYTNMFSTNIWSSNKATPEHRDALEYVDAPGTFRIMLHDENPDPTLYLVENPLNPLKFEEAKFIPRLEDTNTFAWNNLRCMHGSTYDPAYNKYLVILIGLMDIKKYQDLLERSVSKYKDHCMISKHSIENFLHV